MTTLTFTGNIEGYDCYLKDRYSPEYLYKFPKGEPTELPDEFANTADLALIIVPIAGFELVKITPVSVVESGYDPYYIKLNFSFTTGNSKWSNLTQSRLISATVNVTTSGSAIVPDPEPTPNPVATPYNNLYKLDSDLLTQLSTKNLYVVEGETAVNNSIYIIQLLQIPFKLSDDLTPTEANIYVGNKNLEFDAPKFRTDLININVGSITIDNEFNNSLDYVETEYSLILPFVDLNIELEPSYIVGETINIEMVLDAYNGEATINIYNTEDKPFKSIKTNVGRFIPIKLINDLNGSITPTSGINNDTLTAYLTRKTPELMSGERLNLVTKQGLIGTQKGYFEIEDIDLVSSIKSIDSENLKQLLKGGFYVK